MNNTSNHADLVVGHLNAPYGPALTRNVLAQAFELGTFEVPSATALQQELISSLFVECSPMLIYTAASDLGYSIEAVSRLYRSIINADAEPRCEAWEEFASERA